MEDFLEVIDLKKWFPGVKANDGVNLTLRRGEVHAILGENGAGKSTLMKMIYGLLEPTSGEIRLAGEPVHFRSPREAIQAGIGMVHQHFMLIPALTVAENVVLGDEPGGVNYNRREAVRRVRELSERYGLDIDPTAKIAQLSVGLQQRVEILKAFYRKARLIILDEPTALLTPQETRELFNIVRNLKAEGIPVLFISHKLDEVKEISDRVTVMRAGKTVDSVRTADATPQDLANMMVGREVVLRIQKEVAKPGAPVLQLEDVKVRDKAKNLRVKGITLELRRGEILGLAGIDGNGQFELADAIAGLLRPEDGRIIFDGHDITHLTPAQRTERGIAYVPQDRHADGLVLEFDLVENTILRDFHKRPYSSGGILRRKPAEDYTKRLIEAFDVRPPQPARKASELSGGNQQKVILAREVSRDPIMLIAAQPTRGLDVGAIEGIHRQLVRLRDEGKGVLLVSLEMDEILSLSDRIAVIHDGRIVDVIPGDTATREQIGLLMTGSRTNSEVASS
ncbi:ABC transporter ATP-binding protein [Alicyclobacillus acidoterrestris]|uniref:ABC transporter ATP-binding protein n=1 Tax=Alicyclobacillus acidoterrestris (strain ATCC 49025 / DSM 3922 / CIP 106132 / NCIMB 13137 / GD3B) TaxID=1356854 RepID=T0BUQ0_ALIAG|nr:MULTISPECIES: ABC transporter ATP-binding protein [Alicyclobacillus]EPZ44160.1 heme ABC transporter ATP-binding protein [Alicyclobacillus acidoterrestris ATCC 49025]UNO50751.1 ABC transporter ATP-binding protein [Alicyclobacillus acidoterrestris]